MVAGSRSPFAVAEELADAVRAYWAGSKGAAITDDDTERMLVAAFARAHRCFRSIISVVNPSWEDALVLTRALLCVALRSLYLVQPTDRAERRNRYRAWVYRELQDWQYEVAGLHAAGIEIEVDPAVVAAEVREAREELARDGVAGFPEDRLIADELDMKLFFDRIYRPASAIAHFAVGSAANSFVELEHWRQGPIVLELPLVGLRRSRVSQGPARSPGWN
jgi:hypothetical protein